MLPPASIPRFVTTTERLDAAETLPPALMARVETLFVKVKLLVTVKSPPVSRRRVDAVIAPNSVEVSDKVFKTSVPSVIARELA